MQIFRALEAGLALMADWLVELFTAANLGYLVMGAGLATAYHIIKAQWKHRTLIFRWQYVTIPLVCAIALQQALQNQQNADCVREFNQVLRERSAVTSDNDRLSVEQRLLMYEWIHNLVFPPPEIAQLPGDDPVRQEWAIDLTVETDKKLKASIEQQRANDAQRAANPLPPPTCGL